MSENQKGSDNTMSKVTVREAAILTGKSRETINTATKDGTISYTHNEKNHKVIDVYELQRVYPIVKSMEEIEQSGTVQSNQNRTVNSQSDLEKEVAVLKERLESLNREKDHLTEERVRERRQLESEIDNLRSSLERTQDQHNKAMLLLTISDKAKRRGGWLKMNGTENWTPWSKRSRNCAPRTSGYSGTVKSRKRNWRNYKTSRGGNGFSAR